MLKITCKILVLLMPTFYMAGCNNSNDDAIRYFEDRYYSVENLINADTDFQEALEKILSEQKDDSIENDEYLIRIEEIDSKYNNLYNIVNDLENNRLPEELDDDNLNKAYLLLIKKYKDVIAGDYSKILEIVKKSNINSKDADKRFNEIYIKASEKLNKKIDLFYDALKEYSNNHNLEIDLK